MLNSDGAPIDVVYDPQSQQLFRYIPFQEGSVVGGEFNVDVAFGMRAGYNLPGPAFFVVWGDNNNAWQSQEWTGIYGSFVDPYKLNYLTTDPVQDNSFPISAIYDHFAFSTDEYAKSWKPKVAYNSAGQKFIVTWRETPTMNALNDTKVNHIRADKEYTGGSYYTPNDVISAISGNENPKNPAIASSTINPTALITWDDYRNFSTTDCDIYGNIYTIQSVPSITVTKPDGGESWYFDIQYEITWTSNSYSNPVRIEYSTDGGATYIEIINSTPNDGSYLWKVPFTISDYCVVKISDATDSDPFDISDRVFKITTTNKIVTNTNDSGLGSLRQAILDANNDPGMDTIIFKIPGTSLHTIQPHSALPIITDPVLIDGFSQPGSTPNTNPVSQGCNAYLNIELDGTYAGGNANGLDIHSGNSIIRGLIINRFDSCGVMINYFGSNKIEGNYIGSNSSGNSYIGNFIGIQIRNCPNNIIGGLTPATRNVIGGNSTGIYINEYYATNNQVLGNFIGVDITGLNNCGQYNNIYIWDSPANIIGGDIEAARNIISGGGSLYTSHDPPIGGINIGGHYSSGNIVKGNYIGTNVYGTEAILNNQAGITVMGDNTTIENNLISGNAVGIFISNVQNIIRKNFIGSLTDGVTPLGNGDGIVIRGSLNVIGGSTIDLGNVIAFNKRDGVRVEEVASQNLIQCNSIFSNQVLGINLVVADGGVTANDPGDIDDGPNFLQNYPVLTNVEVDIGTFITGSLNSTPNTTYRIDFYSSPVGDPSGFGEGKTHLGWTQITTDGNGDVDFYTGIGTVVPAGHVIATTATDPYGNTSEFSNWISTASPATFFVSNTNDAGLGSLRQAIIEANNNPGRDTIKFNIPGNGPFTIQPITELPIIMDPVIIDGYSQPGSYPNAYSVSEGNSANILIELSGANIPEVQYPIGLNIKSDNCTIRGLAINRFEFGISLSGGGAHIVEGCFIGTDVTGSGQLANGTGISVDSANYVTIGGTNSASRNVISGNYQGVQLWASMSSEIVGNYIGTDASGTLYLGNSIGIALAYSQACYVGGSLENSRNIISNNQAQGLMLTESSYNFIQNNFIGLDRTGTVKLGNLDGIMILYGSNANYILNNRIGGNSLSGIHIGDNAKYNAVYYNSIGTDEDFQFNLGNQQHGIHLQGALSNNTAEYNSFENNIIGFNGNCGVWIEVGQHNTISRNLISKNGGKGIETINGGNKELLPPVINSVNTFEVKGSTGSGYHVEIFSDDDDEGRYYLGSADADSSGNFTFTLSEPVVLPYITATCIDAQGNTSEFSIPFNITDIAEEKDKIPTEYRLEQNYPNPFNPGTKIKYTIPASTLNPFSKGEGTLVQLKVYDVLGKEVATLVNEEQTAGNYEVEFNVAHETIRAIASGVYFYQLRAGDFIETKKMMLLK